MDITLTRKQEEGLKVAVQRYKDGEPYTVISGYAGSGKSTLVNFIIAALGFRQEEAAYVAYTGKAADVLRRKGCKNAITAHKLLYYARLMPSGRYAFTPRKIFEEHYGIIVCDEVSMLPKKMWDLLLSHKIYVLALGDPFQLPPIDKDEDNHVLDKPHVFLDEIMRQAQESEIIRLSMHVRDGNPVSTFKCQQQQVAIYDTATTDMLKWADQILCATNRKRQDINNFIRMDKGYGDKPVIGDKIICLHNEWDFCADDNETPLVNGTIGYLEGYHFETQRFLRYMNIEPMDYMMATFQSTGGEHYTNAPLDYEVLTTGASKLTSKQLYQIHKAQYGPIAPFNFDYAYAITTHKAQGSEWDKVLIYEESWPRDKTEHARWAYTAITRAKERLTFITA